MNKLLVALITIVAIASVVYIPYFTGMAIGCANSDPGSAWATGFLVIATVCGFVAYIIWAGLEITKNKDHV